MAMRQGWVLAVTLRASAGPEKHISSVPGRSSSARVEGGAGGGGSLVELPAHAGILRALAGEYERYLTHLAASASNVSACANISRMIRGGGLFFLDQRGDLAGHDAAVFHIALDRRLAQRAGAERFDLLVGEEESYSI